MEAKNFIREREVEGATRGIYDILMWEIRQWPSETEKLYVPMCGAHFPESDGFLGREIDHDEAAGTRILCVFDSLLFSIRQYRVVIA